MATTSLVAGKPSRAASVRFLPSGFVPVTLYLSNEDISTLQRRANSDNVVEFLVSHLRRKLLRKGGAA